MGPDDMVREFFLGFIKVHILHHAAEAPVYGLALIAELRRHGYALSPGKLYPVLHQLEDTGYLGRLNRVVHGKVRKYYVLTRRGRVALRDARRKDWRARRRTPGGGDRGASCRGPSPVDETAPEPAPSGETRLMARRARRSGTAPGRQLRLERREGPPRTCSGHPG